MRSAYRTKTKHQNDYALLVQFIALLVIGLVFLASSSIEISDRMYGQPYYFFIRQLIYLAMGFMLAFILFQTSFDTLKDMSGYLIVGGLVMLMVVLVVGKEVNGSVRWLSFSGINIQVSELFKLLLIIYLASYIERKNDILREDLQGLLAPILVVTVAMFLLLIEPDFGASFVVATTAMAMLFMAGVRLKYFAGVLLVLVTGLIALIVLSPYRFQRMVSFMNPWSDPFNSGFQLSQALIAIGRGEIFGVGLGASIQKMFYLPEAHTDFVFSVMAEEMGLVGVVALIILYVLFVAKILNIAFMAQQKNKLFESYLCYGYGFWVAIQALINIGVNLGVLPTKGLTLPFISYGGSSLIVFVMGMSLVIKVNLMLQTERGYTNGRA